MFTGYSQKYTGLKQEHAECPCGCLSQGPCSWSWSVALGGLGQAVGEMASGNNRVHVPQGTLHLQYGTFFPGLSPSDPILSRGNRLASGAGPPSCLPVLKKERDRGQVQRLHTTEPVAKETGRCRKEGALGKGDKSIREPIFTIFLMTVLSC